jgi:YbbR domain-containing protein
VGDVSLPPSLEAVEITPGHVEVHIDRKEQRDLPVQPHITGRPGAGFIVAEVEARPSVVRAEGPASELNKLEYLSTDPLDISGARKTVSAKRAILPPGRKVTVERQEAEVKVVIRRQGGG